MRIALSRTIVNDADGNRVSTFREVYQESIALCETSKTLSKQEKKIATLKLGFWLGRLLFLCKEDTKHNEAITIFEELIAEFLLNPTVSDLEIVLPITTHLCSA